MRNPKEHSWTSAFRLDPLCSDEWPGEIDSPVACILLENPRWLPPQRNSRLSMSKRNPIKLLFTDSRKITAVGLRNQSIDMESRPLLGSPPGLVLNLSIKCPDEAM